MSDTRDWEGKTGESWAQEYRRTDRSFGGLTERLLAKTREFSFASVLDIGCGAGELSLAIARGRQHVQVVGVDISEQLVEVARNRGERLLNVEFELADAATWAPPAEFRPELLVSRHGVMFFADPKAAFTHLADIAAPGAGLLFSCFRSPAENELFSGLGALLPPREVKPDPHSAGPLAFADPNHVRSILEPAGWGKIEFEAFDYAMIVGTGEDPVEEAMDYFLSIGPAAERWKELSEAEQAALSGKLREYLATKEIDGIVALRGAAWLVTARQG